MIVARHPAAAAAGLPGIRAKNGNRPVGHGMIGSDRRATIRAIDQPGIRIRPYPTGRILD